MCAEGVKQGSGYLVLGGRTYVLRSTNWIFIAIAGMMLKWQWGRRDAQQE